MDSGGILASKKIRKHAEKFRPEFGASSQSLERFLSDSEVEERKAQPSFVLKAKRNGKGDLPSAVLSLGRGVRGSEPGGAMASCRVASVDAFIGTHPAQAPFFGNLLQMQLDKGLRIPYFEEGDNWADFAWDWKRYWSALTRGDEVGDDENGNF